ncbi:hypothetical protein QJS10_CPA06g01580 [Acorus calamus]|uniref:Uncharacterized protein n=1 Tax=Acorus calamus TaxID=4465 RepID=A0AAV9ELP4_ACOCL|nr:hypothetical protein QJS10_CPA06g01580 [Acorus calamus]
MAAVEEVWKKNFHQARNLIEISREKCSYISLDMEFPGFLRTAHRDASEYELYDKLKYNEDNLKPIQVDKQTIRHYCPTEENFQEFVSFLKENNVDLRDIKSPTEEDEELPLRSNSSELDLTRIDTDDAEWCTDLKQSHSFQKRQPCKIEVPERSNAFERMETDHSPEPNDTQNEDYVSHKHNLFEEDHEETEEAAVTPDAILHRINSMKGVKSYQLGKQLSCKWTTAAGPRIGCVRDYPSEIQFRALEQMNLSPRNEGYSSPRNPASPNPKSLTSPLSKENNGFSTLRDRCSTNM